MKRVLLLDVETSGLDPAKDHLLEVGLVSWSVEHRTMIDARSWLVRAPGNAAEAINRIPAAMLGDGEDAEDVRDNVIAWAEPCDAVIAHNADFDSQWVPDLGKPWVDSAWDISWPIACTDRKLTALALAHGLAVMDAHRALPDCQLLARLLERVAELGHDVGRMLELAMRPKVKVLSLAPFEQKELVKSHGFRWNPSAKVWWRMMVQEDVAGLPFRTRVTP